MKLIKKFLVSKGCNITIIDEHMTSKNCSKCACVTDHQHMSDEDLQNKLNFIKFTEQYQGNFQFKKQNNGTNDLC